jgi:hypothetical protein
VRRPIVAVEAIHLPRLAPGNLVRLQLDVLGDAFHALALSSLPPQAEGDEEQPEEEEPGQHEEEQNAEVG